MKTSNFKIAGQDPNAVAICRGVPRGWKGRRYVALAPSWVLVKTKLPEDQWKARYYEEVLSKLNPRQVLADLGPDAVMLCWEAPGETCHRRLVAEWLEEVTGVEIREVLPWEVPQN